MPKQLPDPFANVSVSAAPVAQAVHSDRVQSCDCILRRPHKDKGRILHFAASPCQAVSPFESSVLSEEAAAKARSLATSKGRSVAARPYKVNSCYWPIIILSYV